MRLPAWILAFTISSANAAIGSTQFLSAEDEAHKLIGVEYTPRMPGHKIAPHLSCINKGGGLLKVGDISYEEWSTGLADCQGRSVQTLQYAVARIDGLITWRIVDALLLPPFNDNWKSVLPNALRLAGMDECELDGGRPKTFFVALVRWGKRERIDWRTGIEQAWTYDIKQGRIVPLSVKRLVCHWWEP